MGLSFQMTNILSASQPNTPWCAAPTYTSGFSSYLTCTNGGSAGSQSLGASAAAGADVTAGNFMIDQAGTFFWNAGQWTVRLNVTTANTNITWEAIYVCRVDSSFNTISTLGSVTGLGISCGTTGVKTANVTTVADYSRASTDNCLVIVGIHNSSNMSFATLNHLGNQLIDSPFDTVQTSSYLPPDLRHQPRFSGFIIR
jgi:hypothetical protein